MRQKAPPESPAGIETRNKLLALQTENREEKNSTITDNSLFFIQMENVKIKRMLSYLENKVKIKKKRSRGCVAKMIKNNINKAPQTRKNL